MALAPEWTRLYSKPRRVKESMRHQQYWQLDGLACRHVAGHHHWQQKTALRRFSGTRGASRGLALTGLEARVRLADHEDLAATTDHLAVAVTGLRRLKGGQDFHDTPREMG